MAGCRPWPVHLPPRRFTSSSAVGHTEFTRLLAEHGAFGLGSLIVLGIIGFRAARRRIPPADKALALAGLAWSCPVHGYDRNAYGCACVHGRRVCIGIRRTPRPLARPVLSAVPAVVCDRQLTTRPEAYQCVVSAALYTPITRDPRVNGNCSTCAMCWCIAAPTTLVVSWHPALRWARDASRFSIYRREGTCR